MPEYVYVAMKPGCQHVVKRIPYNVDAAEDMAKTVSEWVWQGYMVNCVPVHFADRLRKCDCKKTEDPVKRKYSQYTLF